MHPFSNWDSIFFITPTGFPILTLPLAYPYSILPYPILAYPGGSHRSYRDPAIKFVWVTQPFHLTVFDVPTDHSLYLVDLAPLVEPDEIELVGGNGFTTQILNLLGGWMGLQNPGHGENLLGKGRELTLLERLLVDREAHSDVDGRHLDRSVVEVVVVMNQLAQ